MQLEAGQVQPAAALGAVALAAELAAQLAGFEGCMAVIEDCGFRERDKPGDYWRAKVRRRGEWANARMVRLIHALAEESRYELAALCRRFSEGRAEHPEQLSPREAWMLIEMLQGEQ